MFNQVTSNFRRGRIRWDHGSVPCRPLFLWSSLELGLRIEIFRLVFVFVDKTTLFPVRQNQFVLSQRKLKWKVALSTKLRRMIVSPPACLKGTVIEKKKTKLFGFPFEFLTKNYILGISFKREADINVYLHQMNCIFTGMYPYWLCLNHVFWLGH